MKTLLTILLLLLMTTSIQARQKSGKNIGNGGGAIVCRKVDGTIQFAQFYDNWEWKKLGIVESNKTPADQLLQKVLRKVRRANVTFYNDLKLELQFVKREIDHFVKSYNAVIKFVPDANLIIVPEHCPDGSSLTPNYEQVVNYVDDKRLISKFRFKLLVNKRIFNAFSETSKAMLYLHEAVYKLLRRHYLHSNSERTRILGSHLFAWAVGTIDDQYAYKVIDETFNSTTKKCIRKGSKCSRKYNAAKITSNALSPSLYLNARKGNIEGFKRAANNTVVVYGRRWRMTDRTVIVAGTILLKRYTNNGNIEGFKRAISALESGYFEGRHLFDSIIETAETVLLQRKNNDTCIKRFETMKARISSLDCFLYDRYRKKCADRKRADSLIDFIMMGRRALYLNKDGFDLMQKSSFRKLLKNRRVRKKLKGATRMEKALHLAKLLDQGSQTGLLCRNERPPSLRRIKRMIIKRKLKVRTKK